MLRSENGRNIEILPSFLSIFMRGVRSQESGVRSQEKEGRRKKEEGRIKLPSP
ncbi:MAG: hypothetical protein NWQ43_01655 [Dolichospermum sp.]|nr:hypothetical protein [Dolichospermum sp.]